MALSADPFDMSLLAQRMDEARERERADGVADPGREDEGAERPPNELLPIHAQQAGGGQVGVKDDRVGAIAG